MANVCACGCGGFLPEGSTREYKRGHKPKPDGTPADTDYVEIQSDELGETFTLDDAASATPDDPEPRDVPEARPRTTVKVTAAVRRDIEGKVAFGLMCLGQAWAIVDQPCGTVALENSDSIAKRLTPILCQSPDVVRFMTKTGNFLLWINLLMAMVPVIQVVFAHHIAKSIPVTSPNGHVAKPAPNDYVVQ